jgi:8-amino-7-oxononanoate synthase
MFREKVSKLKAKGLFRATLGIDSCHGPLVRAQGREMINFASNNYLGLAGHTKVVEAVVSAVREYGWGSGASRLMSGSNHLHEELEQRLAAFKGTEAALLFNSGYMANLGVIPVLAEDGITIFSDELNHASIIDGVKLANVEVKIYRHCDAAHLNELMTATPGAKMIVTDGVFSMDGDIAPLDKIRNLARKHDAVLYVDDAHGVGVLGKHGRGAGELYKLDITKDVIIGTLSKAFGGVGAYVAGNRALIDYLRSRARTFIFTTALPPPACAATLAALDIIENDGAALRKTLADLSNRLAAGLAKLNIPADAATPIFPVMTGDVKNTRRISSRVEVRGILAPAIRPPTVAPDACRLRVSITAAHTPEQIDHLLAALAEVF